MVLIKHLTKPLRIALVISLISLIVLTLLLVIGDPDTVSASGISPNRDIDISGAFSSGTPEGVWSDGSTIWVVDNDNRKLIAHSLATGDYLPDKNIELVDSNDDPRDIWSNTVTIWVSNWDDAHLYAYDLGTGDRAGDQDIDLASSNSAPLGITGLHGAVYVVDQHSTHVYAYAQSSGDRLQDVEFDLDDSNSNPWGIWAGDSGFWVSDLDDDNLYGYDFSSTVHDPSKDLRLPLENQDPRGIWADGETMWIVDEYDQRVYAIHYRHFRHTDDEIDISAVIDPRGVWTDGETMWVVDAGAAPNRKLLAYRLSDGARYVVKDTVLNSHNQHPVDIWSDGDHVWVLDSHDDSVYVYVLGSSHGVTVNGRSFTLPVYIADDEGICVDDNVMFVAEPGTTTLYAYSVSLRTAQTQWNIKLDSENTSATGVWCDGETIWVLDTADAHVYAYKLNYQDSDFDPATVYRKRHVEFRPSPHNRGHASGFTGHGLRFWVADADDDLLYAYGGLNVAPAFSQSTVEFLVHETIDAGNMVGFVPSATDEEGDKLTYSALGTDAEHFTIREKTGRILIAESPPDFQQSDEYSFTMYVSPNPPKRCRESGWTGDGRRGKRTMRT